MPFEADVVSAHRMPEEMLRYGLEAADRGLRVIIAGAGGAAHLPGMLAAVTPLPVVGVPVPLKHLDGMDSLLSIVQMPAGVPVATVAVGNARNAGLLAVRILAASDADLQQRMVDFQAELRASAQAKGEAVRKAAGGKRKLGLCGLWGEGLGYAPCHEQQLQRGPAPARRHARRARGRRRARRGDVSAGAAVARNDPPR